MHNPDWTERLLARRFGNQRAAEIVGDLQEQYGTRFLSLRVLRLTASLSLTEWMAIVIFAAVLALYQWPFTERASLIPRWFTEHHLTDGSSSRWYLLLTELSYIACILTALSVIRDRRQTQRVGIGFAYSLTLPVLSILAMRPYLRPAVLAASLSGGVLWATRQRAKDTLIRFSAVLACSIVLDWLLLKVQWSLAWTYFLHLINQHRHPGIQHELMWPVAGVNWIRYFLVGLFAACVLRLTQPPPAQGRVATGEGAAYPQTT